MAKLRVYELARELNLTNKVLLDRMKKLNMSVRGHVSALDDNDVQIIRNSFIASKMKKNVEEERVKSTVIRRRKKGLKPLERINYLPNTNAFLFDRRNDFEALLSIKYSQSKKKILYFYGWGKIGKTTLINKWFEKNIVTSRFQSVFGWSFHNQILSKQDDSSSLFFHKVIEWLGVVNEDVKSMNGVERLVSIINEKKVLIILDGLEIMQSEEEFGRGKIIDPYLIHFISCLTQTEFGLCIITSRLYPIDLEKYTKLIQIRNLEHISKNAGKDFLIQNGIQGTVQELKNISQDFGNNALAINLLSSYISQFQSKHVSEALNIEDIDIPEEAGKHPRRIMEAIVSRFTNVLEKEILAIVGLYDRPTSFTSLRNILAGETITGLNEHLKKCTNDELNNSIEGLRQLKLLAPHREDQPEIIDSHPLVRQHFGEKLSKEAKTILSTTSRIQEARMLLACGQYIESRRRLCEIPLLYNKIWERIRSEYSFVFNFDLDENEDSERWNRILNQVEWRRKILTVLGTDLPFHSQESAKEAKEAKEAKKNKTNEYENNKDNPGEINKPKKRNKFDRPEAKGEALEQDVLKLLRQLFIFEDKDVQLQKLRQQKRGSQLGCDIKLEHCVAVNNRKVRCLVECKSHTENLRFADILEKLYDAKVNQVEIDYWILIAPRAKLIGNVPDGLIDNWNLTQEFPFIVQLWMTDTDVRILFGLEPDVYDRWIDHPPDEIHPRNWSKEKRVEVRQAWINRLKPPLRMPKCWAKYVTDRDQNNLFIENDDRESLNELWRDNLYIPPQALDESGSLINGGLEKLIKSWLSNTTRVCIVLGDFGDGKTAFTYMISRKLLKDFQQNPDSGWLPVRFPLRQFFRPKILPREFIRMRMEDIGSSISEWIQILKQKNVLIILDGIDEMTKSLTPQAVQQVIEMLVDCCTREFELVKKIMITCRKPFFDELTQFQYLKDKLSNPLVACIENFERSVVYNKLSQLAVNQEQKLRLHSLRHMHDPLGLARKGLFFKMVSQNLADSQADFSSEINIYRTYIQNCLKIGGKVEFLEKTNCYDMTSDDLVAGMLEIMKLVAMKMHLSDKDYICLRNFDNISQVSSLNRDTFVRLLWNKLTESDLEKKDKDDALHRVGVRSLLAIAKVGVNEQDAQKWPVEFCHRSIREYFVSVGIADALCGGVSDALKVLSEVDINHEVLRFTAELMKSKNHDYTQTLCDLAAISRSKNFEKCPDEKRRLSRLGKASATLLYKWSGELHFQDWDRMMLDGANLAGANLKQKNFRSSSLRYANLTNAILNDADLRDADLTGVRLEKTGEVLSLSVPSSLDGFYAAYRDGTVRWWSFNKGLEISSKVIFNLAEDDHNRKSSQVDIVAYPGFGLCVWDKDSVHFIDVYEKKVQKVGSFSRFSQNLTVQITKNEVLVLDSKQNGQRKATIFDLTLSYLTDTTCLMVEHVAYCTALGKNAVATILSDGDILIYPCKAEKEKNHENPNPVKIGKINNPSCISSIYVDKINTTFYIACGNQDGYIGLWKCSLDGFGECIHYDQFFHEQIHTGVINAICFADKDKFLSGGKDGKIYCINLTEEINDRTLYELNLLCQGAKIAGLKSERERRILEISGASPV